jgi:hypothetical protein
MGMALGKGLAMLERREYMPLDNWRPVLLEGGVGFCVCCVLVVF